MNQQPTQQKPNPNQGKGQTGQSGQQTQQNQQQMNRPGQGGYSSPGHGSQSEQSAPADKR